MKRIYFAIFGAALVGLALASPARADDPQSPSQKASSTFGEIFGDDGVIKYGDTLNIEMDRESGELRRIVLKKNIRIKADLMDLQCDELEVDNIRQIMIAKGNVKFSKDDVDGVCGRLTYYIDTQKTVLEINPVVNQKDEAGKTMTFSAEKITMDEDGISTEGGGEILLKSAPETKSSSPALPKETDGEKVDAKSVGKIPSAADKDK